jgi:hypothetical protein
MVQGRFVMYVNSVVMLWTTEHDFRRCLRQFPNMRYLHHRMNRYLLFSGIQYATLGYFWITERVRENGLTLEVQKEKAWTVNALLTIRKDRDSHSLGFVELNTGGSPVENQSAIMRDILECDAALPLSSPWKILRAAFFPGLEMTLHDLERLLEQCPNLERLSCRLNCPSNNIAGYMTHLESLFQERAIDLDSETAGAGLLVFARHLAVCRKLHLAGPLHWSTFRGMGFGGMITKLGPVKGCSVSHTYLAPKMEIGWMYHLHEVAQTIRNIIPSSSVVKIRPRKASGSTRDMDYDAFFANMLQTVLTSLEQEAVERYALLATPGWSKRENLEDE